MQHRVHDLVLFTGDSEDILPHRLRLESSPVRFRTEGRKEISYGNH